MLQYDSDKNSWSGLLVDLKNARKGVIDLGEEFRKFYSISNEKGYNFEWFYSSHNRDEINQWVNDLNISEDSLNSFLKTWDGVGDVSAAYQKYMIDNGKATTTFATLTKKAGNIIKSFGATLVSMGISWLAGQAFGLIFKGIDNLVHAEQKAFEAAQTAAQEAEDAFDKAKSEYEELSSLVDEYTQMILEGDWDNVARERAREIQEQINNLVDDEITGLDDVNGKLEDSNTL